MAIHKGKPTKDGRRYYFTKYKNGVNHTSKKYMTSGECEKAESAFILKNDSPIHIRFDLVADEYFNNLKKIRKWSTVYTYLKDYNKHILPFFGKKYINILTIKDIQIWAEKLEKNNYKLKYLNKMLHLLKAIFDYGIKNYGLSDNPVQKFGNFEEKNDKVIKDTEKIRFITLDEFNKFISIVDNELWNALFTTLFYTGARKGEIVALTWEDIDFNCSVISINKTLYDNVKGQYSITSTKNNLNRKIKMSKTLKEKLYSYKCSQLKYSDFEESWFVFGGPIHLANTTIDRYKHHYFQISGVHEITLHEFRHSHVSLLINEYIKSGQTDTAKFFLMMSDRMGHTIDVMQKTYMHLFPTVQDEIVNLLDNL